MTSGTAARWRSRVPWRPFARGRGWRGRRGEGRVRVVIAVRVIAVAVEVIAVRVIAVAVEVIAVRVIAVAVEVIAVEVIAAIVTTITATAVTAIVEVPVAVGAVIITEVIVIDTIFVCFTLYQLSLVLLYR